MDRNISPGENLAGSITIHTPRKPGAFHAIANLLLTGKQSAITLKASAQVIEHAWATPRQFDIEIADGDGGVVTRRLTIHTKEPQSGSVTVEHTPPWCRITKDGGSPNVEDEDQSSAWSDKVTFSPSGLPTTRHGSSIIEIAIGGDARFRVAVPVELTLSDSVTVSPAQVYFGRCGVGESLSESFVVEINDPGISSTSIFVEPGRNIADVVFLETKPLTDSLVRVTVRANPETVGVVRGNILIQDREADILASLPVFGLVEAKLSPASLNRS